LPEEAFRAGPLMAAGERAGLPGIWADFPGIWADLPGGLVDLGGMEAEAAGMAGGIGRG